MNSPEPFGRRPRGALRSFAWPLALVAAVGCSRAPVAPLEPSRVLRERSATRAEILARLAPAPPDSTRDREDDARTTSTLVAADPPGTGIARAGAEALALERNPGLRVARAGLAASEAEARLAGLPPDPTFSFAALRVLESVASTPWLLAGALDLPLGALALGPPRRQAALARLEIARAELAVEESRVAGEIGTLFVDLQEARAEIAARERLAGRLAGLEPVLRALSEADAIRRADARAFRLERVENERARDLARAEAARLGAELGRVAGLPGATDRDFQTPRSSEDFPGEEEIPSAAALASATDLPASPTLRLLEAERLAAFSELALARRGVFLDATAGPAAEYEEGTKRIGAGASIRVPLWNRNREAIAAARGRAEAATLAWEVGLEDAAARLEALASRADALRADLARIDGEISPLAREQLEEVELLASLGELDVFLLLDALVRAREVELERARAEAELARVRIEIEKLAPRAEARVVEADSIVSPAPSVASFEDPS